MGEKAPFVIHLLRTEVSSTSEEKHPFLRISYKPTDAFVYILPCHCAAFHDLPYMRLQASKLQLLIRQLATNGSRAIATYLNQILLAHPRPDIAFVREYQ